MKRILMAVAICGLMAACGRDKNDGSGTTATVPQNCVANGGVGCSWNDYPQYYQAYPTSNQGYYSGYNAGYGYSYTGSYFGGCSTYGAGIYPAYHSRFGLACVTIPTGYNYSWYTYQYSGYQAYQSCSVNYACPSGISCRYFGSGGYGLCSYN